MEDIVKIYKEVKKICKHKFQIEMVSELKKRLMENIKEDSSQNETVSYDRDKFLYYKADCNAYDINHVAIILAVVSSMLSIASLGATLANGKEFIWYGLTILALIAAFLSLILILKEKLLYKIGIARKVSVILDEIEHEIWQGKEN